MEIDRTVLPVTSPRLAGCLRPRAAWPSLRVLGACCLFFAALMVLPACMSRDQWFFVLEEATGETDPRQQLEGVALLALQGPVATQDLVPTAHAGAYPFGANTFFEQEVEERKMRRSMEMLRDAGIKWVRQQFPWDRIEVEGKGRFDGPYGATWQQYDRIVALAPEYGLELVVRLDQPPPWTRKDNTVSRSPPDDFSDYGDFVAAVADRYKGQVRYYQIWNEPNTFLEWGRTPDAAEYVRLLEIASRRARAVDPEVIILSAALSPTLGSPDGKNESDLTYLQKMYNAGAKDYFDIASAQGYGLWTGPGDRRADPSQVNFSRVQLLRAIMVRNGDERKAIWLSEMGWDAVPLDHPEGAPHGRVTEEQQARYTRAAFSRIQEEWPWVGVVFYWYFRKVSDDARAHEDFYFRLVDPDFTPRPVYYALQEVTREPSAVSYGWHQEDHWALTYEPPWERGKHLDLLSRTTETHAFATAPGSRLTFAFKGSDLTLVTARGPRNGRLAVQIDGSPASANRVPRAGSGDAVIDLRQRTPTWNVRMPIAAGLEDTTHTATFTSIDSARVVVDGLIVTSRRGTFQQGLVSLVVLGGGVLAVGAAVVLGRSGQRAT